MKEPNLHQLRIFCEVAETGSFSRASEKLFISQPAVSVQIRTLEESLGVPLIHRKGRGIGVTDAGQIVLEHAQRIFNLSEAMHQAVADLKGLQAGRLSIASSTTPGDYLLPPLIGLFKQRYPKVDVELHISNTPGVLRRLLQHEIDLGFVGDPLEHPDVRVVPFRRDEIVAFAGPDHPFVKEAAVPARALGQEGFVLREPGSATRKWAEQGLHSLGVSYRVAMELGSNEAVKRAVAAGLGLGMLSRYAVEMEVAHGVLGIVRVAGLHCQRWLYLAHHRQAHLTRAHQAFVDLALREVPGAPPVQQP